MVWSKGSPDVTECIGRFSMKCHRREKAIKEWKRGWKIESLEISNPESRDLYEELV